MILQLNEVFIESTRKKLVSEVKIDVNSFGVYMICGKSGSGKTTFIETILKQNKTINMTEKEKSKDIMNISGGEFVILALIRCFVRGTPIMIFDEPTNNLDNGKTKKVNDLLNEISSRKTIIISTHDDRLNLKYHTEYCFGNGQIIKTLQEKNNVIKEIK
jgi:ABC-type lipoprotein export system ATPase subunit